MPSLRLDLRGLPPDRAPDRGDLADVAGAAALVVCGPVPALAGALTALLRAGRTAEVPVAWEPAGDAAATALAGDLGLGTGGPRELSLVRDDHGGVLLHAGRIEPAPGDGGPDGPDGPPPRRLGMQAHNDAEKVADGYVLRLDAAPDWHAVDRLRVTVTAGRWRPARRSAGRAVQVACDPARVVRDGVPYPRSVPGWTWYADDRVRWRLQP
jgi:hypothetical protein